MDHPAIEILDVGRVFTESGKNLVALDGVSFTVGQGEIVGLLGGNGAGKTTLTKILSTLLLPTTGTARVLGADVLRDPTAVRARQSVVLGGDRGLYGQLTARENLRFFGMLDGIAHRSLMARLDSALEEVGLAQAADRRVESFSKGMRQRLHIAIGLISDPRVLLLDEPTVGLDPVEAARLRASVASLRRSGVAVLLTSHYLLDVEELADRVVMLDKGRVTHEMSVADFSASLGYTATVVVRGSGAAPAQERFRPTGAVGVRIEADAGGWQLTLQLPQWSPAVLVGLGEALGQARIEGMEVLPARLEDAFIQLQAQT
ncbi:MULTISPECIES: ABC transporter ATP-binding protein [Kitasatospora]|uniref:ABC transporter ATP-binding protein n=1 Tax=Kitasatospora cystarginea TaxID=58350 RepID=A0ABP5QFA9_9ACTN